MARKCLRDVMLNSVADAYYTKIHIPQIFSEGLMRVVKAVLKQWSESKLEVFSPSLE